MKIWKVIIIDGAINYIEETTDEEDIRNFKNHRRQKTVHKGMQTTTNVLIDAETEEIARKTAWNRWIGVLNREHNVFHI